MWQTDLLHWFDENASDLPWRGTGDPYAIWISEIMLQQTQVGTVIPAYESFLERFPTVEALASASIDAVLKAWEGMGYYRRAHNLYRAARIIVEEHGGSFPQSAAALEELPGIGPYTAGAIASIAFGEAVPAVDGNVIRVLARVLNISDDVRQSATKRAIRQRAADFIPVERPGDFNQALMDLGRRICRPRRPDCLHCPITQSCEAYRLGLQNALPVKSRRASTPHHDVTAAVIWKNRARDLLLIAQRPDDKMLGGLWEFPGGKVEPGEELKDCLRRELREELGIEVEIERQMLQLKHAYTHFRITLHVFECVHIGSSQPRALDCADWAWIALGQADDYAFPATDRQIVEELRERENRLL
jgi:A/G-specific adenine glycosylase